VAYQIELPEECMMCSMCLNLKKIYLRVPQEQISLEELTVKSDFTNEEYPVRILETAERVTGSWIFRMYKVQ